MAPSVIYIDEVEKVFVSDKKKAKEFGGQVCAVNTGPLGCIRGSVGSYMLVSGSWHWSGIATLAHCSAESDAENVWNALVVMCCV